MEARLLANSPVAVVELRLAAGAELPMKVEAGGPCELRLEPKEALRDFGDQPLGQDGQPRLSPYLEVIVAAQ